MPKRKRDTNGADHPVLHGNFQAKQQRLQQKLHHTTKQVAHAFKVAKGFERQKLSRRQKKAQEEKNEKDGERIETEIVALKALDLPQIAQFYFYKHLNKNKDVLASGMFRGLIDIPEVVIEGPTQNVVARLCNAPLVKSKLQDGHDDMLHAAGIPLPKLARKDTGRVRRLNERSSQPDTVQDNDDDDDDNDSDEEPPHTRARLASVSEDEGEGQALQWDIDEVGVGGDDDDDDEDDDDDDGDEGDIAAIEKRLLAEGVKTKRKRSSPTSDDGSDSDDDSNTAPHTRPSTSTILPSLTMGGYISGSDGSEIEDIDVAPRKNRRGQRARQAIWEKKYGAKAKHLGKATTNRDQGWDAKRGAVGDSRGRGGYHNRGRAHNPGRGGKDTGASSHAETKSKPKRDDSGPLHPSWEAAKLAKAKSVGIPAFTGKKTSFD